MSDPVFGANHIYDARCINMVRPSDCFTEAELKAQLEQSIQKDRDMIQEMGAMMNSRCVSGYSWTDTMQNAIVYYQAMIKSLPTLLPKIYDMTPEGQYLAQSFRLPAAVEPTHSDSDG